MCSLSVISSTLRRYTYIDSKCIPSQIWARITKFVSNTHPGCFSVGIGNEDDWHRSSWQFELFCLRIFVTCLFCVKHWNGNIIILTNFSSLAAMRSFIAASDENFTKMTTFHFPRPFQCIPSQISIRINKLASKIHLGTFCWISNWIWFTFILIKVSWLCLFRLRVATCFQSVLSSLRNRNPFP